MRRTLFVVMMFAQRRMNAIQVSLGTPQRRGAPLMDDLATAFTKETLRTYTVAKTQLHYDASYWRNMMGEYGAVGAAKRLIADAAIASDGLTRLYLMKRLDLSVEATVLCPEFAPLFTAAERARAREILAVYEYRPPGIVTKSRQRPQM